MTVNTYYLTFGFRVRLDSYMRMMGYTVEKLTPEIRKPYDHGDYPDEEIVEEWFRDDHMNSDHSFLVDDMKYVVRMFTHDQEGDRGYVVVGIDMGEIDNFEGTVDSTGNNPKDLYYLINNVEWKTLIQEAESQNGYSTCNNENAVPSLIYKNLAIIPTMVMTTDDCTCCS